MYQKIPKYQYGADFSGYDTDLDDEEKDIIEEETEDIN